MDARARTVARARELRAGMSLPEVLLWKQLRRHGLEGFRFRRQHPAGPYILDFYCDDARLAVEVDGEGHGYGDQPGHDERRDNWLARHGIAVLRLPAHLVPKDMGSTLRTILAKLEALEVQPPSRIPGGLPPEGEDLGD